MRHAECLKKTSKLSVFLSFFDIAMAEIIDIYPV